MKKKIMTFVIAAAMIFVMAVTVSAQATEIGFDSAYNAETGLVAVSVYVENAQGLQSADLNLAFDPQMYAYEESDTADLKNGMIVAGITENNPGLGACSVIFTEKCVDADLDVNGRLNLVTYTFRPLSEEYDLDEFCLWASSFDVNDMNVLSSVGQKGKYQLKEEKTDVVTVATETDDKELTTKSGTDAIFADGNSKWYVYVIAGVLAVGAIAGIAFIAIKNNNNNASDKETDDKK